MTQTADLREATPLSGGVIAIRGFVYQFDATLHKLLSDPSEPVHIEDPYDMHGLGWCTEVKYRSGKYSPSAVNNGVSALWQHHRNAPGTEVLRLYCHFKDRKDGERIVFTADDLRRTWPNLFGTHELPKLDSFASRFAIQFAPDLPSQLRTVVQQIQTEFECNNEPDAIATHSILRAHLLAITSDASASRLVALRDLKTVDRAHRACVMDRGYRDFLDAAKYVKLVRTKWFPRNFNPLTIERVFVIDVPSDVQRPALVAACCCLVERFAKLEGKREAPKPPLICVRGLPHDDETQLTGELYDALSNTIPPDRVGKLLPLVDGLPCRGARFRPELLKCNPHARDARLRLLPSSHLSGSFLQHILDGAQLAYHFYVGDASLRALPPEFRETRRIALDDLEQLQQILA